MAALTLCLPISASAQSPSPSPKSKASPTEKAEKSEKKETASTEKAPRSIPLRGDVRELRVGTIFGNGSLVRYLQRAGSGLADGEGLRIRIHFVDVAAERDGTRCFLGAGRFLLLRFFSFFR